MELRNLMLAALAVGLLTGAASKDQKTYRWVDDDGVVHFGDSVPPEYAEKEKQVLNEHGVHVDRIRGKKTEAELAEEARQAQLETERELQRRADQALLATYLNIEEIEMHRDRRIELLRAQLKITDLYIRNLQRRLDGLQSEASEFQPYSSDPDAPPLPVELAEDLQDTKGRIGRYREIRSANDAEAEKIRGRFESDIVRFRELQTRAQANRT